jgi:hypothetical protein
MIRFFRRLSNRHREVAVLLVTPPPLHEQDWEAFLMVRVWLVGLDGWLIDKMVCVCVCVWLGRADQDRRPTDRPTARPTKTINPSIHSSTHPHPIPPTQAKSGAPGDRLHAVSHAYGEAALEVGKAEKVPCVDMYAALDGPRGPDAYRPCLSDGLHLSLEGNRRAFEAIATAIRNNYPWLSPVSLETQGPDWAELKSDYAAIPLYSSKSSIISLDRL